MSTVASKDGTEIAYETSGQGPALILVDGAFCYRSFGPMRDLARLLAPRFTVTVYDRRGRGESGDRLPFALEREVEDLDALIEAAGGSAFVYGLSSGACLALEAAARLGSKVAGLALYEPPYDASGEAAQAWRMYRSQLDGLLAEGRRGEAVVLFMHYAGRPEERIEAIRHAPTWPKFEAVAPTLAYEAAAIGADRAIPVALAARVNVPVLVLTGTAVSAMQAAAGALARSLPKAQQRPVPGQGHDIDLTVLAPLLAGFFIGNGG